MVPGGPRIFRDAVLSFLITGFTLGCIWRFTSWHEHFGLQTLLKWGEIIRGHPWTPAGVLVVYVVGGLLFFAHGLLLWATIFTFDTPHAILYCVAGSLASGIVVYGLGRVLRQDVVARIAGSYMETVSRALAHRGVLSLCLLHIFPVCPFSVLNLLAGATHIRFRDFVLGTILGMTPGILALSIFGNRLLLILRHPNWEDAAGLVVFVLIGITIFWKLRHRLLPEMVE
jgi:uncharacterized membrane protein YdjX (TVP38/TMEM64 family)